MQSFDSFTRLDNVISAKHVLSSVLILFPRKIDRVTMNTFRPAAHDAGMASGRGVGWCR